jgi:hypothetical protein
MTMTKPTSEQVTFLAAGSGATQRNLVDKVRESVSAADFGAVGDGVADDTLALRAAFDYAIPLKLPVMLRGTYRVTGYIQDRFPQRTSGELHVICDGNVTINVDASSAALDYLLACQVAGPTNASITGGSLKIDCALKAGEAIYLYNNDTATGGTVNLECPITVLNCRQNRTTGVNLTASGISCFGLWKTVTIESPTVIQVERAGDGVCRGITVEVGDDGSCIIRNPYIKNVLHGPGGFTLDADGIGLSGYLVPGNDPSTSYRSGNFLVEGGTFVDCQGRSIKVQCSNCAIISPRIFRQAYVTQSFGTDFDFMHGNGTLISPSLEYRLNGSTSPLGTSYKAVAFTNRLTDAAMASSCTNMTIVSDHAMPLMVAAVLSGTNAQYSSTIIDGLQLVPADGFAGEISTRAIVEIPNTSSEYVTMAGTAFIAARNVRGPFSGSIFRATNYTSGAIASKLAIEVSGARNTASPATRPPAFHSFNRIAGLDRFLFRDNHGVSDVLATTGSTLSDFDFAELLVGNKFPLAMSFLGNVLNPPPWETSSAGTGRIAFVEVLSSGSAAFGINKLIRVTTFGGSSAERPKVFVSTDNATTWREDDACPPNTRTADFTVLPTEDVIINNKSGSACVVTLPAAATYPGRRILIKTIQAQAVDSASSNVVPLAGGSAGTAILTGTAGKYAELVSDGTNWVIMAAN